MGVVYLLHFSKPYKHAKHYLGFSDDLLGRIFAHRNGTGARLTQVIKDAGISFEVVRTWVGNRKLERKLKRRKGSPRLCPICRAEKNALPKVAARR